MRKHPLSSEFPSFFTNDSLGALTQIHHQLPALLTDPDVFWEPVWPAPGMSPQWPKGNQDDHRLWLHQLLWQLEWP